jgi:GxxExxY protein
MTSCRRGMVAAIMAFSLEYPHSAITSKIIVAAKDVHPILGPGYQEIICRRALVLELPGYGLEFEREVWMDVNDKGEKIREKR